MTNLSSNDIQNNLKIVKQAIVSVWTKLAPIQAWLCYLQAIHESRLNGTPSLLAVYGNNLFGIKGKGTAGVIKLKTWEHINGKDIQVFADFAKNSTLEDSVKQYKNLLQNGTHDNPTRYHKVLTAMNLLDAVTALVKGGYATDPNYINRIMDLSKQYDIKSLFNDTL